MHTYLLSYLLYLLTIIMGLIPYARLYTQMPVIYLELSGAIWSYLDLSAAIWNLELSKAIWSYVELSELIWSYLELPGTIWR